MANSCHWLIVAPAPRLEALAGVDSGQFCGQRGRRQAGVLALDHAQQQGVLVQQGAYVHLPEHGVRLSATEERIAQKALPHLLQVGAEGAWARDLAKLTAEPEPLLRATLARLARRGELHQVVKDLYYAGDIMRNLAHTVRRLAAELQAADFRDATGLGRKRAIQILEYFDRIGLLRRVGDVHKLRVDCPLFREDA